MEKTEAISWDTKNNTMGIVKRRFCDSYVSRRYHLDYPSACDDNGHGVRDHHLVEFEQFVIHRGKDQRNEEKEQGKSGTDEAITPEKEIHGV